MSLFDTPSKQSNMLMTDTNYISAGDGEIYINNVLVDECYDIQFSYREMKEPIYGYRSKYYSTVLPGTVLISGQFTINYIHDAYLYALLTASNTEDTYDLNIDTSKLSKQIQNGLDRKNLLQQYNYLRKEIELQDAEYANLEASIKVLESSISDLNKALDEAKKNRDKQIEENENNIDNWKEKMLFGNSDDRYNEAQKKLDDYYAAMEEYNNLIDEISSDELSNDITISYSDSIFKKWNDAINLDASDIDTYKYNLYEIADEYKTEIDKMLDPTYFDTGVPINTDARTLYGFNKYGSDVNLSYNKLKIQLEAKQEQIKNKKAELTTKKDSLKNLKNQFLNIKDGLSKDNSSNLISSYIYEDDNGFKTLDSISFFSNTNDQQNIGFFNGKNIRPEDNDKNITLAITYNGIVHKKLIGVRLIGHSHLLGVGGQPIQESYMFIAKKIENA